MAKKQGTFKGSRFVNQMSNSLASELDLDFQFLPSWAQQPVNPNRFANYQGSEGDRPPRRGGGGGGGFGQGGGRGSAPRRDRTEGNQGSRPPGGVRDPRSFVREDRGAPVERREPSPRLPEFNVNLMPDEKGVEMIARQIKLTGRSYPLFNIAQLVLKKPDRFHLKVSAVRKSDGKPVQSLWVCSLDESIWLSEADAIQRVFDKYFDTFYKAEQMPIDAPKGVYTFVAQCGMSGVILGPPNYHDYQTKLRRLHAERFPRLPFEAFKARVKIVRDEAVVKKWIEQQSFRTEYTCLNLPEPLRLSSREDVEKHFKEVHGSNIIKQVDSMTVNDLETRNRLPQALQALVRMAWEDQKRFPLKLVTLLSQQLAGHGLQFFKVNKTVTHVSVSRPRFLDMEATPVSDGVKKIVDFINSRNNSTRRMLLECLAPSPSPTVPQQGAVVETGAGDPAAPKPHDPTQPTAEQSAIIADLHWLVHQGNVIEFSDGRLETAKRPLPKPVRPPERKQTAATMVPGTTAEAAVSVQGTGIDSHGESEVSRAEFDTAEKSAVAIEQEPASPPPSVAPTESAQSDVSPVLTSSVA